MDQEVLENEVLDTDNIESDPEERSRRLRRKIQSRDEYIAGQFDELSGIQKRHSLATQLPMKEKFTQTIKQDVIKDYAKNTFFVSTTLCKCDFYSNECDKRNEKVQRKRISGSCERIGTTK